VLAVSSVEEARFGEELSASERSLLPTTAIEQDKHEFIDHQRLRPDASIDTHGEIPFRRYPVQLESFEKIRPSGFSYNCPWLPPNVLKLLNKARKGPLSEKELIGLMGSVAERASTHFQLSEGKFVAMTFLGRIVEISDTRVGLLKKLQGRLYPEQIFVWRTGSNAFSGRL